MRKGNYFNFSKRENNNREFLEIEGTCFDSKIKIILVYFDVDKSKDGEKVNAKIRKDIEKRIEVKDDEGLIILGDFNGHIRGLGPQETDFNGKMVLEWLSSYQPTTLFYLIWMIDVKELQHGAERLKINVALSTLF